ncbi:MAG TPA: hypothetical protein VHQ21_04465, partial [Rhodanobacteraceae bacterium]|nr:hypothetical protein [Rhodanobacteraceae bacterium]
MTLSPLHDRYMTRWQPVWTGKQRLTCSDAMAGVPTASQFAESTQWLLNPGGFPAYPGTSAALLLGLLSESTKGEPMRLTAPVKAPLLNLVDIDGQRVVIG